jgi:hypothetical protein
MNELTPGDRIDLGIIETNVRVEVLAELLEYAATALVEVAALADRIEGADAIGDHVSGTLDVIQARIEALAPPEVPDAD